MTKEDGNPLTVHPARTPLRIKLKNPATDLAGFCWTLDHPLSVSNRTCTNTWVPVAAGGTETVIEITPTGFPQSTFHVLALDKAGNHSPVDGAGDTTVVKTSPAAFVYPTGQSPVTKRATHDLHGDLNGDGYTDMLATDAGGRLRFYAGNGNGEIDPTQQAGLGGWGSALIAHGGDFANGQSPTLEPDGYEDIVARLADGNLYLYPGTGTGEAWYWTRRAFAAPSDLFSTTTKDPKMDGWGRVRQIILPGDIDQRTDGTFANGKDLVAIECDNADCTTAHLRIYSGQTLGGKDADQAEPFELQTPTLTHLSSWKDYTIVAIGDQNADGVKDLVSRNKIDGKLYFYPGQMVNGKYTIGSRTLYGNGGWETSSRPLITSSGNAQGTVLSKTANSDGTLIPYKEFQPKPGDEYGDLWATTPADPNYTVRYDDAAGTPQTTTCPAGCLLFYPGAATTHRNPRLVGTSGWNTTITGIF